MTASKSPRPFLTLGLKPFLWASSDNYRDIQKRYFQLSREFHPDRMGTLSDSQKQILEATSSKINLDYSKLKDPHKLAESIITGLNIGEHNVNFQKKTQANLPPQLASEYFDLQELWEEKGLNSLESQSSAKTFLEKVQGYKSKTEEAFQAFLKKFPFQGFGDAAPPWSNDDLSELKKILQELRYLNSFLKDFESRFSQYAHTN